MNKKVVVTGGLGFIFSHVTEYLVSKGYDVLVIDNQSIGSHPEIIDGSFKYLNMDVADTKVIFEIVDFKPDYIIHASAISDVDYSIKYPYETLKNNVDSTFNIFEAARRLPQLKKLVYVSTDEIMGECDHKKKEDEIIFPKNPYSCSKAVGSLLRMAYDNTFIALKDKTAETRFCNIFGPRQDDRKILGVIKRAIKEDISIPVHNEGKGYREYLYVKNIPEVVELVMLNGNRTYNVSLNEGFTVKNLIAEVEEITGKKIKTTPSDRQGMDLQYQLHNGRILELGWKPKYYFKEAIKDYLFNEKD